MSFHRAFEAVRQRKIFSDADLNACNSTDFLIAMGQVVTLISATN